MIEKLEYLIALSREKHFGRAADACKVTQPSLSLGLRQLEETLGVALVQRGSRFIGLTPEGERTLEWARRIVADSRAMHQDIDILKNGLGGRLTIAVIPAALPISASITRPLFLRHPTIDFTILSRPSTEIPALLENLEVDAAVTYLEAELFGRVTAIPLYRERYQLLTSRESPLGKREQVTWRQVAEQPLCLLTPDTQNRQLIETMLKGSGGEPRISVESDSMMVLFAHVRTGSWVSVMPRRIASTLQMGRECVAIPIVEPDMVHTIGLVTPLRDRSTPLATALATEARSLQNLAD